ncbi:MBL fold metallo-hydrolase [Pseudonocardia acidicola]|uniref:MBL fold metallo-hydrolase n=1 Tax=Pseudonocardia acidicola TaxID=2724939 RepID=A0ABX1S7L7_9PSEU|nr:MBL fold metallo-hydrolase [Pseudonocardia acidicola]NMH97554.1 MBL fold metallo-hydrolase [Pseudonocardia acidicola]
MSISRATAAGTPAPTMEALGKGFHAFVQLDGSWGLNNAGVFVGDEGVVLIDTAFTAHRGRALRDAVAALTDKPVRTVINTHHHGDHTYGNFLFPAATIIGHDLCREATIASGFETQKWFPDVDWGDIRITPPAVTFADSLTVWCDDMRTSLRFLGPAHTSNDVIAWVEEQRLLFAGDLVFNGGTPFVVMGSIEGIIAALEQLDRLGAEVVVPGHGSVCGPEVIGRQLGYLRFVQETAADGFRAGLDPLELARRTDLGDFAGWTDSERLVGNLHRAYSELRGEPLGGPLAYDRIVDEMVEFNGGRPLHCVA